LRLKAESGIGSVVEEILNNQAVKKALGKTVIRQSLEAGLFLSCLIVGGLSLMNAFKAFLHLTWQADLAAGLVLIAPGIAYFVKKLKT